MGDISEMMQEGILCSACGTYISEGKGDGYGRFCDDCNPDPREASKRKRASNREYSSNLLRKLGIPFESKKGGAHLIIEAPDRKIDFWPGAGKWIDRKAGTSFRGVRKLIRHYRKIEEGKGSANVA